MTRHSFLGLLGRCLAQGPRAGSAIRRAGVVLGLGAAGGTTFAANFAVQEINSPGPAVRMSSAGLVTGFYVAKCTTLSSQPKRTLCYNAPWLYDGRQLTKLANRFPGTANAKAVAINEAGDVIGADTSGAWYYSAGSVAYVDAAGAGSSGSRLAALNNAGVAVGMSTLSGVYQPISYSFQGAPTSLLAPGYVVVDLNDARMIAGWFRNASGVEQAFVASSAGIDFVPNLAPSLNCRAVRLSQVDAASGAVWLAGNCANNRPFRYKVGSAAASELLYPGSTNLGAVSVNSRGDVAGSAVRPGASAPDGYTALLWPVGVDSVPIDLNANRRFAPAGAWNVHATDLNDTGTVLTGYNDTSGNFFTFLLRPQP